MKAEGEIDEADAGRIAVGQRVTFRLDAHPDDAFTGRVQSIGGSVQSRSSAIPSRWCGWSIDLDRTDPQRMRPGMRFHGTIETEQVAKALVVAGRGGVQQAGRTGGLSQDRLAQRGGPPRLRAAQRPPGRGPERPQGRRHGLPARSFGGGGALMKQDKSRAFRLGLGAAAAVIALIALAAFLPLSRPGAGVADPADRARGASSAASRRRGISRRCGPPRSPSPTACRPLPHRLAGARRLAGQEGATWSSASIPPISRRGWSTPRTISAAPGSKMEKEQLVRARPRCASWSSDAARRGSSWRQAGQFQKKDAEIFSRTELIESEHRPEARGGAAEARRGLPSRPTSGSPAPRSTSSRSRCGRRTPRSSRRGRGSRRSR